MALSFRCSNEEEKAIREYAAFKNISISELIKDAVFDKIEDEFDLQIAEESYGEYIEDSKTYSLEDVLRLFD